MDDLVIVEPSSIDDIEKALTLTQPWGGLVAAGHKPIENRGWNPPKAMIGKRFALHASREIDRDVYHRVMEIAPELADRTLPWFELSRVTSAIIGIARLVRVVSDHMLPGSESSVESLPEQDRRWFFGPKGFVLAEIQALREPIPCPGSLSFWRIPKPVREEMAKQFRAVLPGPP